MEPSLLIPTPFESAPNLHPMFVHFPAALLPAALALFALGWWRKSRGLFTASKACVCLGALGAFAAVITGWNASESIPHDETLHRMMETHKYAALIVLVFAAAASGWCWKRNISQKGPATVYAILVAAATLTVISVGDLGARMVYSEGAAVEVKDSASHGDHEH